jgi:tetratricopeptide (TPR) repeat protein
MALPRVAQVFEAALGNLRKHRYNRAYDQFTEAMEMDPERPEIHYNRGLAAGYLYRWDDAVECFRMALRLEEHPDYWIHLGLARLHLRDWEEALYDFNRALEVDHNHPVAIAHRDDLERFLGPSRHPAGDAPSLCYGWYDPRLESFEGVDPEIVDKAERARLREYVREALEAAGGAGACDHTHRFTEEWALHEGRDPLGVSRFLYSRGLRCDCQVLGEGDRSPPRPADD